jgi:hypothetical protein
MIDLVVQMTDKASKGLGDVSGALGKLGLAGMGISTITDGVGNLVQGFGDLAGAASAEKLETDQLVRGIKAADSAFDGNLETLDKLVAAGEAKAFGDSEVRASLQKLTAATGDVAEASSLQALAMDVARAKGISLEQATTILSKAQMGSLGGLEKLGVQVDKNTTLQGALAELTKESAGAADLFAESSEGAGQRATAAMDNAKESIGAALLPLQQQITGGFVDFLTKPETQAAIDAVAEALSVGVGGAMTLVTDAVNLAIEAWSGLQPVIEPIVAFISDNLEPILLGLATALLVVVVPAFVAWATAAGTAALATITALAPVLAPIAAIALAVAALKMAWDNDFGGIRTTITTWWEQTGKPIFEQLQKWLEETLTAALQTLSDFWTNTLQPALEQVWKFIQDNILPILGTLVGWLLDQIPPAIQLLADAWNNMLAPALNAIWTFIDQNVIPIFSTIVTWLSENIPPAIQTLADFWNNTLLPAITAVWDFLDKSVIPLFRSLADVAEAVVGKALEALAGLWEKVLKPAFQGIWDFITTYLKPIFDTLVTEGVDKVTGAFNALVLIWDTVLAPALNEIWTFLSTNLQPAIKGISDAIDTVIKFFNDLATTIGNLELPDWLTPGSPTPLETGLLGVKDALGDVDFAAFMGFMREAGNADIWANLLGGAKEAILQLQELFLRYVADEDTEYSLVWWWREGFNRMFGFINEVWGPMMIDRIKGLMITLQTIIASGMDGAASVFIDRWGQMAAAAEASAARIEAAAARAAGAGGYPVQTGTRSRGQDQLSGTSSGGATLPNSTSGASHGGITINVYSSNPHAAGQSVVQAMRAEGWVP